MLSVFELLPTTKRVDVFHVVFLLEKDDLTSKFKSHSRFRVKSSYIYLFSQSTTSVLFHSFNLIKEVATWYKPSMWGKFAG